MNCIRCGREIEAGQVFCGECLEEMEKYPVKPGIAIQLPKQREAPAFKKAPIRRRTAAPEEQIHRLQKAVVILATLLLVSLIVIGFLFYPLVKPVFEEAKPKPGQNYSTIDTDEPVVHPDLIGMK